MDMFTQIKWLSYKYFLLDYRSWKLNTLRIILPFIGAIAVLIFVNSSISEPKVDYGTTTTLGDVPKCAENLLQNGNCVSIIYYDSSPNGLSVIGEIMQKFCELNPTLLTLGVDVVNVTTSQIVKYGGFMDYLYAHSNYTYGAIEWTFVSNLTNTFEYTVFFNDSYVNVYNMIGEETTIYPNNQMSNIETAIERAIAALYLGKNDSTFYNVQLTPYPDISNSEAYSVTWNLSIVIIYCVVTFNSLVVLVHLVSEKEEGIRGQMKFSGLRDFSFWICEITNQLIFGTIGVVIMVFFSWLIPSLVLFHDCNLFVMLIILWSYQFNANALSSIFSTFISIRKTANILACIIFAVGLTIVLFAAISDDDIYEFYGGYFKSLLVSCIPWYSFTKAVMDVKLVNVGPDYVDTGSTNYYCLDYMPQNSTYFTFGDMFNSYVNTTASNCQYVSSHVWAPTTFATVIIMLVEGFLFYLIALYLDKVLPTDKYRATQSPFFFLRFNSSTIRFDEEHALFIEHLSKTYKKHYFASNGTLALKPFLLKCPNSSILCLLGPNGAGKTTAITCLTGLTTPSEGDAYIYGLSIVRDMDEIRKHMGICPQFDLLWPDLTAWEHMRILNGFKGKSQMSEEDLLQRLADVRLTEVRHLKTKGYSGGMKRRLSVVISTIGNPLILFLDEPTTGMDPDNRQYVWKLIKQLKEQRLVILTSHSMEEADHLGDVVAIMAKGKLRCYGRPLELKSRFGLGFRVTLTTSLDQVNNLKEYVGQILPGAQLRGENAGSLVYNLPDVDPDQSIIRFFEKLERSAIPGISDWGIQNTTLEDVYLSISRKVMGQDISFEGAQMFDRDERQMFRDSVGRYEEKMLAVQTEIDQLRRLLEYHSIDHSVVPQTKSRKKFVVPSDNLLPDSKYQQY